MSDKCTEFYNELLKKLGSKELFDLFETAFDDMMSLTENNQMTVGKWTLKSVFTSRNFLNYEYAFIIYLTESKGNDESFSVTFDTGIAVGCQVVDYKF